ncbi:condensation domain-containing protein, partial [Rhizobium paknamense]
PRLPLSYAQTRLWLLSQIDGPSAAYNIPFGLRLDGPLQEQALSDAFYDVVNRHESLRTIFVEQEGVPYQEILETYTTGGVFDVVDIDEASLPEAMKECASYCFDLSTDLPIRAWLFRLGEERNVLLLLIHHIAGDGWSFAPLCRDLSAAYTARCLGKDFNPAPLPVQYADYTLWQREVLGSETDPESPISQQLAYWQKTLSDLPEHLDLPTDRPRPAVASHRGEYLSLSIDAEVHDKLLALARQEHASLFMVLQAGLATLLTRLGCGFDIPIGSPIAGRTDDALDDLVGFF